MAIIIEEIPKMDFEFTEEELRHLEEARKSPIVYDDDSPDTTPERAVRFRRVKRNYDVVGE